MKTISLLLILSLCGCSTISRQRAGRPIADSGQAVSKTGTLIIVVSGICPLTIQLCVLSLPFYAVGVPMYYGGKAIAKDEKEEHPFEL